MREFDAAFAIILWLSCLFVVFVDWRGSKPQHVVVAEVETSIGRKTPAPGDYPHPLSHDG